MKNKIFLLLITLLITSNAGFCTQTRSDIIVKFSLAMGGVIVASIVIWLGLTIYNKILMRNKRILSEEEEILVTPRTIDEAIKFFVRKNRLR